LTIICYHFHFKIVGKGATRKYLNLIVLFLKKKHNSIKNIHYQMCNLFFAWNEWDCSREMTPKQSDHYFEIEKAWFFFSPYLSLEENRARHLPPPMIPFFALSTVCSRVTLRSFFGSEVGASSRPSRVPIWKGLMRVSEKTHVFSTAKISFYVSHRGARDSEIGKEMRKAIFPTFILRTSF